MSRYLDQRPPRHLSPEQRREWHVEQRRRLSADFGGIDRDVEQAFYDLPEAARDELLREYGRRWGRLAEEYARETFHLWRTGRRRMSGQTARRLLELVPPRLPLEQRLELIRRLRAKRIHLRRKVRVTPADWRPRVEAAVAAIVAHGRVSRLPEDLVRLASWLADEDRASLRPLLLRVEEAEARLRADCLAREYPVLAALAGEVRRRGGRAVHTLELPTGSVVVEFQAEDSPAASLSLRLPSGGRAQPMERKDPDTSLAPRADSLLDQDLEALPEEERDALRRSILEQRLRLDTEARSAEQRFAASVRDMQAAVDFAGAMNELDRDFEIRAQFRTGSGQTEVRVSHTPNRDLLLTLAGLAGLGILAALLF